MKTQTAGNTTLRYTPYGFSYPPHLPTSILFNGEFMDPALQVYLLGLGTRSYSTTLMRFFSPDSLSPFGTGGINTYNYCSGDPINFQDPSGQSRVPRQMRREFVIVDLAYFDSNFDRPYQLSRRPVKQTKVEPESATVASVFNNLDLVENIVKQMERKDTNGFNLLYPAHSISRAKTALHHLKTGAPLPRPMYMIDSYLEHYIIRAKYITETDGIHILKRRIAAHQAGYFYTSDHLTIALARKALRIRNDDTTPETQLLW